MAEADALASVLRRYFYVYGPSRPSDFREWSSPISAAAAGALFESLSGELEEIDVEGRRAYVLAGDTEFPQAPPSLRLLPEYDVYVMGFREREHLVPEPVRELIAARGRGRYEGTSGIRLIVVDGVAAGVWDRVKRGRRVELHLSPVPRLTRALRGQLVEEAQRIGACLGLEPVVTVR